MARRWTNHYSKMAVKKRDRTEFARRKPSPRYTNIRWLNRSSWLPKARSYQHAADIAVMKGFRAEAVVR